MRTTGREDIRFGQTFPPLQYRGVFHCPHSFLFWLPTLAGNHRAAVLHFPVICL
jgi:hypothetical protein